MVAFSKTYGNKQRGSGIMDNLLKPFTYEKYTGEHHGYSLNPKTFLQPFSYTGPGTAVLEREKRGDTQVLGDLDKYSKKHDYTYLREKTEYGKDHNKQKHIQNIWKADDEFIENARNSKDEPIMGHLAAKLISTKRTLEKTGLMDSKVFSGFGAEEGSENGDPVARLRLLVQQQYKTDTKKDKKGKTQKGGILPALIPIGVAIASTLAGKLSSDLYDFIKKKITGSGTKVPYHKSKQQRIDFIKEIVNKL